MTLLLVVDGVFAARRGVQLSPRLVPEPAWGLGREPFDIRLVRPDGSSREGRAELDIAHVTGPRPPYALCRVLDVSESEVPIGTRVYLTGPTRTATRETPG